MPKKNVKKKEYLIIYWNEIEYRNMIKEMKIKSKATRKRKLHYFPT